MIKPPILAIPNFKKLFILKADASGYGLGAVQMQDSRSITFLNKLLDPQA